MGRAQNQTTQTSIQSTDHEATEWVSYRTQNSQHFTVFLLLSLTAIWVRPSASSEEEKPMYLWLEVFSDLSNKLVRNFIGPEKKKCHKKGGL